MYSNINAGVDHCREITPSLLPTTGNKFQITSRKSILHLQKADVKIRMNSPHMAYDSMSFPLKL